MRINLTKEQIKHIYEQLTPNELLDLLGSTPNASLDVICKFIYLYMRSGWQQEKLKETIASTPLQMELFPETNIP